MRKFLPILILALLVAACRGRVPAAPKPAAAPSFPMVTVPGVVTDPAERTAYLAEHFWDEVKTVSDLDSASLELAVGTWASLLGSLPADAGENAVKSLLKKADTLPQEENAPLLDKVEKYLYDPNSPVRNEDLYGRLAQGLAASQATPDSLRAHYAYLAEKCALNAVGTRAADFLFTRNGRVQSLYSVTAERILLIFGNPECTACRELHAALKSSEELSALIKEGKLALVEVNPDEDGIAKAETDRSYHIRAIPSMYLLDENKTVLLKDATPERILKALQNN